MKLKKFRADGTLIPDPPQWTPSWRGENPNLSLYHCYRSITLHKGVPPCPTGTLIYHKYWELDIFVEGDLRFKSETRSFPLKRGDIIITPPYALHNYEVLQHTTPWKYHTFCFELDAFAPYGCKELTDKIATVTEPSVYSPSDHNIMEELLLALEKMHLTAKNKSDPLSVRAMSVAYAMQSFYYINQYDFTEKKQENSKKNGIAAMMQYLDDHFIEIHSINEVAEHFFYSREYVSRLFKRHLNTTVADYIREKRIAKSRELIKAGVPLLSACYQVGYDHPSTFIRAFRAVTGMTPSAYRHSLQET